MPLKRYYKQNPPRLGLGIKTIRLKVLSQIGEKKDVKQYTVVSVS